MVRENLGTYNISRRMTRKTPGIYGIFGGTVRNNPGIHSIFTKTILQKILGLTERSGTRRANILRLTAFVGAWGAKSWELQHFGCTTQKSGDLQHFRCMMHKKPVSLTHCVSLCVVHNSPGIDSIFWCMVYENLGPSFVHGAQKSWDLQFFWYTTDLQHV